ncbi:MAG: AbrB/MazE/SpoVT family DNA-binding domain-containing protein [Deltaproteobacteria bacterium]|nr:AbrB/MazE/SpoVT family DNA-binding domain-containing protein [Deltaproteobacteria bacterium]
MAKALELKVYEKGQIVLPLALREKLRIKGGSRVRVFEYGGIVYLLPERGRRKVSEWEGILPSHPSLSRTLLRFRKKDFA